MRLLLDENLPKRLKLDFPNHEIFTVADMGWTSLTNGRLLEAMLLASFDVLLTFDKNIQHQQNFLKYPVAVLILVAPLNSYEVLKNLVPSLLLILENEDLRVGPTLVEA